MWLLLSIEKEDTALWQRWLDSDQSIKLVFQPLYNMNTGRVTGYEILSRFFANSEFIRPDLMFEHAALHDVTDDLDLRIVTQAAEAIRDKRNIDGGPYYFINLHPRSVEKGIIDKVRNLDLPWSYCVWEVTESGQWSSGDAVLDSLAILKNKGSKIAIDDFGAGYSSLTRLLDISPHYLKIDMALIRGLNQDNKKMIIVESILSIGNRINCLVVAEGVETVEELSVLRKMGAVIGQGYLLSRPLNSIGGKPVDSLLMHQLSINAQVINYEIAYRSISKMAEDLNSMYGETEFTESLIENIFKITNADLVDVMGWDGKRSLHALFDRSLKSPDATSTKIVPGSLADVAVKTGTTQWTQSCVDPFDAQQKRGLVPRFVPKLLSMTQSG